jgi:hypothetical protein
LKIGRFRVHPFNGDWELDTVIGKGHRQPIVSMTELKSRLLRLKKVNRKTGKLVKQAICEKLHGFTLHTLTSDNGREFSKHAQIARACKGFLLLLSSVFVVGARLERKHQRTYPPILSEKDGIG